MLSSKIVELRLTRGLSQGRLAALSGVSLPYIQRLERGNANPSVEVLTALGKVLGFELELRRSRADWDTLAAHGAPLLAQSSHKNIVPTAETLIEALYHSCLELENDTEVADRNRKILSTQALCWAVQTEFPTFYKRHFQKSPLLRRYIPKKATGELIKLKRIAASALSQYL